MANRSTDALFQLIKSLEKSEKRNFKLYVNRNSSSAEDLKTVQLFDALDKMPGYDEPLLLKKNPAIRKQQLSNIKASLYKQLLASLRLLSDDENIDIYLNELMAHARILYNKGLCLQSLKTLEKIKEIAAENHQVTFLQQALFFEKKIEMLHITRSMQDRAELLSGQAEEVNQRLNIISQLSNLSLLLYSWYIKNGHARNTKDEKEVDAFINMRLTVPEKSIKGFYEKLYWYQCNCWKGYIKQDFLQYYRYSQKWFDLFQEYEVMIDVESLFYLKSIHHLLGAHFALGNYKKFNEALAYLEQFSLSDVVVNNTNCRIHTFTYLYTARLNKCFMEGSFKQCLYLVDEIEAGLEEFEILIDRHRVLVLYYKIACLYFGAGDYEKAVDYLNKIIHWKVDLRNDLQCYARLLHLIAHYELGNFNLLEYLTKSVYRFMAKMENLSLVEEEMFKFLRNALQLSPRQLKPAFEKLLARLRKQENNRFETRAFVYLDVISWLESKLQNRLVQDVVKEKYMDGRKRWKG